jgi:hypothetical protein
LGGAEGVRQKGWTCGGRINILREAKTRNIMIKDLEQGDNQIVVTFYKRRELLDQAGVRAEANNA